jgi:uncharacterized protein YifN (PemK superfamily)
MKIPSCCNPPFKSAIYFGAIFLRKVHFDLDQDPHEKYCIILSDKDDDIVIYAFSTSKEPTSSRYRKHDIYIPQGTSFFKKPTWIRLDKVRSVSFSGLKAEYEAGELKVLPNSLSDSILDEIVDEVKKAKTIKNYDKERINDAYTEYKKCK